MTTRNSTNLRSCKCTLIQAIYRQSHIVNHYLRYTGLETLVVTAREQELAPAVRDPKEKTAKTGKGAYFAITLAPHAALRKIANGLGAHRKSQLTANADTEKFRAVLAGTRVDQITRDPSGPENRGFCGVEQPWRGLRDGGAMSKHTSRIANNLGRSGNGLAQGG